MAMDRSVTTAKALNVTVNGKTATMLVKNMSDDQLRAALLRPDNRGALADGWYADGGKLYKRAAAPVQEVVTTPKPGSTAPGPTPVSTPAASSGGVQRPLDGPPINQVPVGGYAGYLKVRQKQADGTWKVVYMHSSKLTEAQRKAAMANGLNGPVPGTTPKPGGGAPAAGGGGGTGVTDAAPAGDVPVATSPTSGGGVIQSWIPPMVGLGGLNADPTTGKIDWSKIIGAANEISAVDPQYAQDLSNNIWSAMQGVAPMQSEIQSLTTIDPTTGKTLYQSLFDGAQRKYKQDTSRTFGTAAARGIGSSGMVNSTLANQTADNANQIAGFGKQYGNQRIADLLGQMTGQLAQQDTNFTSSYYAALSRAQQGIPNIPTPS